MAKKIISAHQPAYLPWLGYIHKVALSNEFIILDNVQFEKNSFTNRNKIKGPKGVLWLTVPLHLSDHFHKNINQIEIDNSTNWSEKHWTSIFYNYKKAPFFDKYSGFLEDMYHRKWDSLLPLTMHYLKFFLDEVGIHTELLLQSNLGIKSKKNKLILDLCKTRNADIFIFGNFGKDYADQKLFSSNNINVVFQEYNCSKYQQLWGEFIPNLTSLDALLNLGPRKTCDIIFENNISKIVQ
ncbi:MAG: WbqC family protein [Ignavibacteria bacterium]|nr:WbqC family protein [Ignavibacteria bacterium]